MDRKIHSAKVRVEFEDCDAMGVVYHPNYLKFVERSRIEYLRAHGIPFSTMLGNGAGLVVAEIQAFYWRPVKFEEEIYIYTRQIELSEKKIVLEQFISREPLTVAVLTKPMAKMAGKVFGARLTLASVDLKSLRACPLPEKIAKIMADLTVQVDS